MTEEKDLTVASCHTCVSYCFCALTVCLNDSEEENEAFILKKEQEDCYEYLSSWYLNPSNPFLTDFSNRLELITMFPNISVIVKDKILTAEIEEGEEGFAGWQRRVDFDFPMVGLHPITKRESLGRISMTFNYSVDALFRDLKNQLFGIMLKKLNKGEWSEGLAFAKKGIILVGEEE